MGFSPLQILLYRSSDCLILTKNDSLIKFALSPFDSRLAAFNRFLAILSDKMLHVQPAHFLPQTWNLLFF